MSKSFRLLAAATAAALVTAFACLPTALAQTGSGQSTAVGPSNVGPTNNDLTRCTELYNLRNKYRGNGSNYSSQDTEADMALDQCKKGHADAGIAELESELRQKGITVPRPEAAHAH